MEILEFNQKKELLIIKENDKKIKYSMSILNFDDFKIAYCKKYTWNFFSPKGNSMSEIIDSLHAITRYETYLMASQMTCPFIKTKNTNYFIISIENNELVNILDNEETVDFIESIKVQKKLLGVI